MSKITVVYDTRTNKIIPFVYADNGEIILLSDLINEKFFRVKMVESSLVDWDGGYIYDKIEEES